MPGLHDSMHLRSSHGDLTSNGNLANSRNYSYYYSRDGLNGGLSNGNSATQNGNGYGGPTRERRPSYPEARATNGYGRSPTNQNARNGLTNGNASSSSERRWDDDGPSYWVEHLATFAVGRQFGLEWPADGIRKLKQMERSSAIWAQPMVLRLKQNLVQIEDENGELVEHFPLELVAEPTAHISTDPRDLYNNILLFVVREDRKKKSSSPTEMHIFQCSRVSANEVAEDIKLFLQGKYTAVRSGRRDTGYVPKPTTAEFSSSQEPVTSNGAIPGISAIRNGDVSKSYPFRDHHRDSPQADPIHSGRSTESDFRSGRFGAAYPSYRQFGASSSTNAYRNQNGHGPRYIDRDEASMPDGVEFFERDVNTLNRCFDEIERFVARIQQAALAQREIERRGGVQPVTTKRRDQRISAPGEGLLALRAQFPTEPEFVDILQKFKLCFNLLAKLKHHIKEPNAPELLHFLFTPLTVILDASRWGLGENIGPRVIKPLITREAKELMMNCLTSKESEVWNSLGDGWKIPVEDWLKDAPSSYHPIFIDGYMPYGAPIDDKSRRKELSRHSSVNNLVIEREFDKLSIEKERLALERERIAERERRLAEEERRVEIQKRELALSAASLANLAAASPTDLRHHASGNGGLRDDGRHLSEQEERMRLSAERQHFLNHGKLPSERSSFGRPSPADDSSYNSQHHHHQNGSSHAREHIVPVVQLSSTGPPSLDQSPRNRAFVEDLQSRRAHIAQVTYDRTGQNAKELSVEKGEYLEVLNDTKNWWECGNIHGRIGYVPKTILENVSPRSNVQDPLFVNATSVHNGPSRPFYDGPSTSSGTPSSYNSDANGRNGGLRSSPRSGGVDTPDYIQQRMGKKVSDVETGLSIRSFVPQPPAPPPPLSASALLSNVKLKPVAAEDHGSNLSGRPIANGTTNSLIPRGPLSSNQFQEELRNTVSRKQFRKANPQLSAATISEESSEEQIAQWLRRKGFSNRTCQVLDGQTGALLFCLTKAQLQQYCGLDEGARLFSQVLVQKTTSGYKTKSASELKAILAARKMKAEEFPGSPDSNGADHWTNHSAANHNPTNHNAAEATNQNGLKNRPFVTTIFANGTNNGNHNRNAYKNSEFLQY